MMGSELLCLTNALQPLEEISTQNNYKFSYVEALALTCAQLTSTSDKFNLSIQYNHSQSLISEIFNKVIIHLDERWKHLLDFDSDHLLSPTSLKCYANAIYKSRAPLLS